MTLLHGVRPPLGRGLGSRPLPRLVDLLGEPLQRLRAILQASLGRGSARGAEQVPGADRPVPAAQPLQALLRLIELGQGQLALGHLPGQLGLVLAAVTQKLRPFGFPLLGEQGL